MSKSVYSPTSKLKVHPEVRRKDSTHSVKYPTSPSVVPGSVLAEGERMGGAPTLLEAINKNGLVLFLLVREIRLLGIWTLTRVYVGQCHHRIDQSLNTNNVRYGRPCNGSVGSICVWHIRGCLDVSREKALALLVEISNIMRTVSCNFQQNRVDRV